MRPAFNDKRARLVSAGAGSCELHDDGDGVGMGYTPSFQVGKLNF